MRSPLLLALLFAVLYAGSLSPNLGAAHDGVYYLRSIESGHHLLHPHHLLYNPAARAWWRLSGITDAAVAVPLLNALAGGLTAGLLFVALRRFSAPALSLFFTTLWGFSFGPWFYSATIEVYMLPLPLLLGAWLVSESPTSNRGALAGALTGLAVLFHQTNLLFGLCALLRLRPGGARPVGAFLVALALVAGGGYLAAWRLAGGDAGFAYWSTAYLHQLDLGRFTPATPLHAAVGAGRFFIGGHFAFALPFDAVSAVREGHHFADEFHLVRGMTTPEALGLLAASALWFAALLGGLALRVRRGGADRAILRFSLAWFIPYALFFAWWEPSNVEFWIGTLLPAFIALAALAPSDPPHSAAWLLPAALLVINFLGSILPLEDPANDWYAVEAARYRHAGTGDVIEVEDDWILGPYIERLTGATVVRKGGRTE